MDSLSNLELIYSSGTISLHDRREKLWLLYALLLE